MAGVQGALFVSTFGNQQHFTYLDDNDNLQDCWYDGDANRWNLQQINNANGTGPGVAGESVAVAEATAAVAIGVSVCTYNNQQHFTYMDVNVICRTAGTTGSPMEPAADQPRAPPGPR